jgi:hypothetical protein
MPLWKFLDLHPVNLKEKFRRCKSAHNMELPGVRAILIVLLISIMELSHKFVMFKFIANKKKKVLLPLPQLDI